MRDRVDQIAEQQGWDDASLLELALTYIENQQSDDAFIDFLQVAAAEENHED